MQREGVLRDGGGARGGRHTRAGAWARGAGAAGDEDATRGGDGAEERGWVRKGGGHGEGAGQVGEVPDAEGKVGAGGGEMMLETGGCARETVRG